MKHKVSKFIKIFFALLMVWTQVQPAYAQETPQKQDETGLGVPQFQWDRDMYPYTKLEHIASENHVGLQKTHTIQFDPQKAPVRAHTVYGKSVMGGETLSQFIEEKEQQGETVVFAINGDGYDTSNMNPLGLMVQEGILITSSEKTRRSVGFMADGRVVFGDSNIKTSIDGMTIDHVNRERKMDQSKLYLMTEAFGSQTDSSQEGIEVILKRTQQDLGIRIGAQEQLEVVEVRTVSNNPQKNTTPIEKGHAVLATHTSSQHAEVLKNFQKGQQLTLNVENQSTVAWQDVQAGIGVFTVLMEEGKVSDVVNTDLNAHPRSAMGITDNGEVIFMQNDGRQASFAEGITYRDTVESLKEMGATTVFNFDGGGSSTLAAQLPGNDSPSILNRPSDGKQRANANGLVFTSTLEKQENPSMNALHLYPSQGYANRVVILEQGVQEFEVKATDASHNSIAVDEDDLVWSISDNLGTLQGNTFKAGKVAGKGSITVESKSLGIKQSMPVEVVDSLTLLRASKTMISVGPGKQTQLEFYAESNGTAVSLSNEALTFSLSDPSLGSIDAQGIFTAEETSGTGNLSVSYKDYTIIIPIEVGKLPVVLNGFEDELENNNWKWRFYNADGTRGGDGSMSINRDERFVKRGDASLRIDYDNASKPVTGTVTIEAGPEKGYGILEGQPKAIGAWVYGDNSGAWIRIQLAPSVYAGDIKVDWHGWKYIETPIPDNAQYPYELVWGIRVLTLASSPNNYKKGTIYFDELRAIYDYKNDDALEPSRKADTKLMPQENSTENPRNSVISLQVQDPIGEDGKFSGIAMDSTRLWINGNLQDNVVQTLNQDNSVSIQYSPSALTPLRSGNNHIKVRVEDNAGNKFFETWQFNVEGYAVELFETLPDKTSIATNETFEVKLEAKDYRQFELFEGTYTFNDSAVELLDVVFDSSITDASYERDGNTIHLKAKNMDHITKGTESFVTMVFKAKDLESPSLAIHPSHIAVKDRTQTGMDTLILNGYDVPVQIPYTLTYSGVTHHYPTNLTIRDRNGQGVEGVGVVITLPNGEKQTVTGQSDVQGNILTSDLTAFDVGSKLKLQAIDASGLESAKIDFEVMASLGSDQASNVVITGKNNPSTEVGITWRTALDIEGMTLKITEDESFKHYDTYTARSVSIPMNAKGIMRLTKGWAVDIENLKPSTQYFYQIDEGHIASFTTGSDKKETIVKFYGDFQGGFDKLPEIEKASQELYPTDVILQPGDFSDNHNDYHEWETIDQQIGHMTGSKVWLPATGNHDVSESGDDQVYMNTFNTAKNGVSETGRDYYVDYGNTRFYVMDSEAHFSYDPNFKLQLAHMKKVFETSPQKFKAVMMHRPVYAMSYDEPWMRALAQDFEAMDIDLVLTGHDHIYSRTSMYQQEKVEIGAGPTYVVMGTSTGSKYYNADLSRPWTHVVYDDNTPTFGFLKMTDDAITVESYTYKDGKTESIDQFEIKKDAKQELEKMIAKANELKIGDYTPQTQKQFVEIIDEANAALTSDQDTQIRVTKILGEFLKAMVKQDPALVKLANLYSYAVESKHANVDLLSNIESFLNENNPAESEAYYQKLFESLMDASEGITLHYYILTSLQSFNTTEGFEALKQYLQGTNKDIELLSKYLVDLVKPHVASFYDMMGDYESLPQGVNDEIEKDRTVLAFLKEVQDVSDKEAISLRIQNYLKQDQVNNFDSLVQQLEQFIITRHDTRNVAKAVHQGIAILYLDQDRMSQIDTDFQTLIKTLGSLSSHEERIKAWTQYLNALDTSILDTQALSVRLGEVNTYLNQDLAHKNQRLVESLQEAYDMILDKVTQQKYTHQKDIDEDLVDIDLKLRAIMESSDKTMRLEKESIRKSESTILRVENFEPNQELELKIEGYDSLWFKTNHEGFGAITLNGKNFEVGLLLMNVQHLKDELEILPLEPKPVDPKPVDPKPVDPKPEEKPGEENDIQVTPNDGENGEDNLETNFQDAHEKNLPQTGIASFSIGGPLFIIGLIFVFFAKIRKRN